MAIDTALKRFSMMKLDRPWSGLLHRPTGSIGAAERQSLLFKYSGIAFSGPPAPSDYVNDAQFLVDIGRLMTR
jgi:hypothetical protein